jgi:hypothetical protein
MTRPNLLLVMVVLGLYLVWQVFDDVAQRRERITRLVLFSIPGAAGCLVVAWFNAVWNGSPLRSGYPPGLFGASYWDDNILHFSRWLSETQTPLFFIGFLAPFATRWLPSPSGVKLRAAATLLVGVMLAVFASYLFYLPFDAWWYLRFLLPGYPALAVATCIALAAVAQRFGPAARVVVIAAVAVVIAFGLSEVGKTELLGENRYRLIGEWVRDRLPANAIVFTSQHSGNVNHYSGRPIVRYDLIANTDYQSALQEIVAAGYHPYLVIDEWETQSVRDHAAGPHGALDWPPIAELQLGNVVKVWDLGVDPDAARASQRAPEIVPIPESIRQQLR